MRGMKIVFLSRCVVVLFCASALTSLLIIKMICSKYVLQEDSYYRWKQRSTSFSKLSEHKSGVDFMSLQNSNYKEPICEKDIVLIILVTSAPWHLKQRNTIRNTWAKKQQDKKYPWQTFFLIGHPWADGISPEFVKEQELFGDILLGNYADCYRNLTLKVMHGLWWTLKDCEAQYILKTDDDCFVNSDRLVRFLVEHNTVRHDLYIGSVFAPGKRQVIRDPESKWYVSKEDFLEDNYPPYASGIGYLLSLDAAYRILTAAQYIPVLPVEDAYVGILANKVGLSVKSSGRFTKYNINWRVCNYRYLMVIHHLDSKEMHMAHQNMIKARTACSDTAEIIKWK
ncbi:beta-1,3-galactosyltransferase 5-like [Polypterus senegalus]|nr:beta-1,3-galactosyltransferase 5-like [Polypterus senegalus]